MQMHLKVLASVLFLALVAGCSPGDSIHEPRDLATDDSAGNRWADLDQDGDGYTPRMGDCDDHDATVHPNAPELCDGRDSDCDGVVDEPQCDADGDGYTVGGIHGEGKDCYDHDKLVNPGAVERVVNKIDDDCDGLTDELEPPCDGDLKATDATAFAGAIEICAPWITAASWVGQPDLTQHAQLSDFGDVYKPFAGRSFILLSTGVAADENDPGFSKPRPGTRFGNHDPPNPAPMDMTNNICGSASTDERAVHDYVELSLRLKVPTNAVGFSFRFNFFSSEYWANVGSRWNDTFLALLDSQGYKGNIAKDKNNKPIAVNSAFFDVCEAHAICNGNKQNTCSPGKVKELAGTGYEIADQDGSPIGGATGWLMIAQPITPGETATLRFILFDEGDHLGDSSVLIDDFEWQFEWNSPGPWP